MNVMTPIPPVASILSAASSFEWIKVSELIVYWPDAQRPLSPPAAQKIADEFNPDSFGTLTVCTNPLFVGFYHTIDGWTRANGIIRKYGKDERVPCTNLGFKTKKEAAALFAVINGGRTKPTPIQIYTARVSSGEPAFLEIEATIKKFGLSIEPSHGVGCIRCAGALVAIHGWYGQAGVARTMDFLNRVWSKERSAYDAHVVLGAAHFLHTNEYTNIDKVTARVAKKYTPARLIAGSKATREAFGGSTIKSVSALLREAAGVTVKPIDIKPR